MSAATPQHSEPIWQIVSRAKGANKLEKMTGLQVPKQLNNKSDKRGSTSTQLLLLQTMRLSVWIDGTANTVKIMGLAWKCSSYPVYTD